MFTSKTTIARVDSISYLIETVQIAHFVDLSFEIMKYT